MSSKRDRAKELIAAGGRAIFSPADAARPIGPGAPPAPSPVIGPAQRPVQHPGQLEETDRALRRDIFNIPPVKILERGPYIREWDEDGDDFARLCDAVRARGEIDTPIWVRSEGGAGKRVFILVAGKGRLKAALKSKLATVPVRDLGPLSDKEALERQAQENEHRNEMSLGNKANAFWVLETYGHSTSYIGKLYGKDKSYISILGRVGEAIAAMPAREQALLRRHGAFQYREAQTIAALPGVDARQAALREILHRAHDRGPGVTAAKAPAAPVAAGDGDAADVRNWAGEGSESVVRSIPTATPPTSGAGGRTTRPDEVAPFYGRPTRNGRTFRMKWDRNALRSEPRQLAEGFLDAVRTEAGEMLEALRRLEEESAPADRDAVTEARRVLERFVKRS